WILENGLADNLCRTRNDVENAGRKAGLIHDLHRRNIRQWRCTGRLHDYGITAQQRRSDLVAEERQREIPRHDRSANTDRLLNDHAEAAIIELRDVSATNTFRHSGVMVQSVHKSPHFQYGFAHRFSLFLSQESGEFFFTFFDLMAGFKQYLA